MNIKIYVSIEFLESLIKFPQKIQEKIVSFFTKFIENPKLNGINFKKINSVNDKQLYRIKIDEKYRGIIYIDDKTGIYHLLWVDDHDETYESVDLKKYIKTGNIGIENKKYYDRLGISKTTANNLFSSISTNLLLSWGVEEKDLFLVRNIKNSTELKRLKDIFPEVVYSYLEMAASDFQINEIKAYKHLKMKEFIKLLYDEVIKPGLEHPTLDQKTKESLENTYMRIKNKKFLTEIIDFYYDALLSTHGQSIAKKLAERGLNNFEKIEGKVKAFVEKI